MGELLAGVPTDLVTSIGGGGLLALAIWLVLTGRLVPKSTHEETRLDRDEWRKTAETTQKRLDVISQQMDKLLASSLTVERFMTSLQEIRRKDGGT